MQLQARLYIKAASSPQCRIGMCAHVTQYLCQYVVLEPVGIIITDLCKAPDYPWRPDRLHHVHRSPRHQYGKSQCTLAIHMQNGAMHVHMPRPHSDCCSIQLVLVAVTAIDMTVTFAITDKQRVQGAQSTDPGYQASYVCSHLTLEYSKLKFRYIVLPWY